MNTKLQELTDKIYNEGVEKGNAKAQEIVTDAEQKSVEILEKANAEAKRIIAAAEQKSAEITKNTQSELKLFANQSLNALKTEITNVICGSIVADSVKAATEDKSFMQKTILTMVEQWAKDGEVIIDAKDGKSLTEYFTANAKHLLDKGVKIVETNGLKTDFTISKVEAGGYKVNFGEEEFISYFKEFLRPKLVEMLF